jgi:hypothetical protein
MMTQELSPSAYQLRKTWEQEDRKFFKKFKNDPYAVKIINALAEMMVQLKTSSKPKNLAHF